MQIQVSGKQIDIGDSLRTHVTDRVTAGVSKYFDGTVEGFIAFSKEGSDYKCVASVHLSSGISLKASGQAGEIYSSFELAAERLEKRLRRYKRRLKDHHNNNKEPIPALAAAYTVFASSDDNEEESADLQPVIVAEDVTKIKTLTTGEAVMQMDLDEAPVLFFKNRANDRLNVVYQRADGNIGWIDPENGTN